MRAAIYARVSTEEQTQNFSIENQLDNLRKYCHQRDFKVTGEYVDPGWSGTIIERPALTKLLKDAKSKLFDSVIVYKLDRLFRNSRHMYNTLAELEGVGVCLASVTEPFDTTTTMGKAYLGMASTFAEWERNTFIDRSRDGTKKLVEKGMYAGGIVAYGYRFNPETKRLEIEEQESKVVADMYRWLVNEGMSSYSISQRLNALGVPTRYCKDGRGVRGKATAGVWRPGRVYNLLTNPAYKGEWVYGKRISKKAAESGKKPHLVQCSCPAIVDSATFEKAISILKSHYLFRENSTPRAYLLKGIIKCGLCGHSYVGCCSRTANGERLYYKCDRRAQRANLLSEACYSPTVRADAIQETVWEDICNMIQHREIIEKALNDKFDVCQQATYVAELAQTRRRQAQLKTAEQRLLVKYADPANDYSEEALKGALGEIRNSLTIIQNRILELESTIATEEARGAKLSDVQAILDSLAEKIPFATDEIKRQVFEQLIKVIRIGKTEAGLPLVNIVYWFDKELTSTYSDARRLHERMSVQLYRQLHLVAIGRRTGRVKTKK